MGRKKEMKRIKQQTGYKGYAIAGGIKVWFETTPEDFMNNTVTIHIEGGVKFYKQPRFARVKRKA